MNLATIEFEGIQLPPFAHNIDLASNTIDDVPESVKSWFFHFTVCVGTANSAPGSEALQNCRLLHRAIGENRGQMIENVTQRFDDQMAGEMIDSWIESLEVMMRLSEDKDSVNWTGTLTEQTPGGDVERLHAPQR